MISEPSFKIRGIAFCGRSGVGNVEVSIDANQTWQFATMEPWLSPYAWVLWHYDWPIPKAGEHVIMVRVIDGEGQAQSTKPGDLHAVTVKASSA